MNRIACLSGAVLAVALAGCGGSSSKSQSAATQAASTSTGKPASTTKQPASTPKPAEQHLPAISITVSSPAFKVGGPLPAQYTCSGADVAPTVRWSAIPSGTRELAVFAASDAYEAPHGGPLIYWAVTGLKPTLRSLSAADLPAGAIVGRNSAGKTGYSFCPPKGKTQRGAVIVLAMNQATPANKGFNAESLYQTLSSKAENKGYAIFTYQRP
jgi:phosphatidylethanolamine-binding protein (PEBP) family uncharacterized protein